MNIDKKREREKKMVSEMISRYCRKNHKTKALCDDCRELEEYARLLKVSGFRALFLLRYGCVILFILFSV